MAAKTLEWSVDVLNPGQVLACCGLLEAAHRLDPSARGWFADGTFCLEADAGGTVLGDRILRGLRADGEFVIEPDEDASFHDDPVMPLIIRAPFRLRLDWWLDARGEQTSFKTWAGQMKVASIMRDLRDAWSGLSEKASSAAVLDLTLPLSGRFGFDPRASWNALDVGFSPNEQGFAVETSPLVELLAALALSRFRPAARDPGDWRLLSYRTWLVPSPPRVAALRYAGAIPAGGRTISFRIDSRAKYKNFSQGEEGLHHEAGKQ